MVCSGPNVEDLPGTPHAIILASGGKKSHDPLKGAYLCTVPAFDEKEHKSEGDGDEKDEDATMDRLAGKKRHAQKDDGQTDDTFQHSLQKRSRASTSATVYEAESSRPTLPVTRHNKKGVTLLTQKSDVVQLQRSEGRHFRLIPNPSPQWRKTIYTAGPAGCGKSTFVASYLRAYLLMFKHAKIYGLNHTKFSDDPAYRGINIRQLKVSFFDPCGNPPFQVEDCVEPEGSMFIFDDWDTYTGEEAQVVEHAIASLLNLGRKYNISVIVTSHLLSNYSHTRKIVNAAEWLVVYPHHTQTEELTNFLRKVGMKKEEAEGLRGISGKWCAIHQSNPTFVLSEFCARMI